MCAVSELHVWREKNNCRIVKDTRDTFAIGGRIWVEAGEGCR
jgi:hypothetical protein